LIKLDCITPGPPQNSGNLPPDDSRSMIAYHNIIVASGWPIHLDISWKLECNSTYLSTWIGLPYHHLLLSVDLDHLYKLCLSCLVT
jgi:hypothetical protein